MTQKKLHCLVMVICLLETIGVESESKDRPAIIHPRFVSRQGQEYIEIGDWTIKSKSNEDVIVSDDLELDRIVEDINELVRSCDLRQGTILGERNSLAVLTICNQEIYGLLVIGPRRFYVEPVQHGWHTIYESDEEMEFPMSVRAASDNELSDSVIETEYEFKSAREKRNSATERAEKFYNLTGDTLDWEFTEPDELTLEDNDPDEVGHFYDHAWSRDKLPQRKPTGTRDPSTTRWLKFAIAADYSVVQFHGSRVRQYILALLNIVSAIYRDSSLESNTVLVIVRIILYGDKKDGMVRNGNARRSLENVNKWNRKLLSLSEEKHDVAVWLTRLDIGGPSGYAPVSGLCDPARSCALNRDEGLTSAFIIAHEVAHVIGLTHDGDEFVGNTCGKEALFGSVMAPMVAATFHRFHWSSCSRKEFHRKIKKWSCLLNEPSSGKSMPRLEANAQEIFSMDEQCRMEFGDGYELCKSFDLVEPCSHLWCGNTNVSRSCKTKKGPPLEGTSCGIDKWCVNGFCASLNPRGLVDGSLIRNTKDDQWSEWSEWERCSRTCNMGIQIRTRKCLRSVPTYGDSRCLGPSLEYRLCQLLKCPSISDFRAQQCSRRNITWLPHESERESLKCRLTCRDKDTGEIIHTGDNVTDGTLCSYGSSNICIRGSCRSVGCDNVPNTKKVFDSCGVCDGDNSECELVSSKFQRKVRREMTRVIVLPHEAYGMVVNITIIQGPSIRKGDLTFLVRDGKRKRNDAINLDSHGYDSLVVEGAHFRFRRLCNDTYTVKVKGQVFNEIIVSIAVTKRIVEREMTVAVSSAYSVNRKAKNHKNKYVWLAGGWGPCSVSCGGGMRLKTLACQDERTGKIVSRKKCPLISKPKQQSEKCNALSCEFKWITGSWEACSTSCGNSGIQHRQLYCVHSSFNDSDTRQKIYRATTTTNLCKNHEKPLGARECNRVPCLGHWVFTEWSTCSANKGKGIQSRMAHCVPPAGESLYTCEPSSNGDSMKPCKDDRETGSSALCKKERYFQYCTLPILKRYCDVPGYRKRCCRYCNSHDI